MYSQAEVWEMAASSCHILRVYVGLLISLWLSKGNFFLQNNSAPHTAVITHKKLADLYFEVLKYPAYSPDFAPSDCYLFPNLKNHLKGRTFSSTLAADS
jgi:hypothetical protein